MPEEMKPAEQPTPAPQPPAAAQPSAAPAPAASSVADTNKLMGAISYLSILFIIPLLTEAKNDETVKFHIRQGIVLFIIEVVASILMFVPFVGGLVNLALLVVSIYGAVQAYQGVRWELPVVGQYAKQIKI